MRRQEAINARGTEIPWFTYPAIEYLGQLDFSTKTIFEFGTGNSTIFWGKRAAKVIGVEHNALWYDRIRLRVPGNVELHLVENINMYGNSLALQTECFDVIVVDGIERHSCCAAAIKKLRPGGLIILDNADWHHRCAAMLKSADLIEVDFMGFGPINGYTWTTSMFLHRAFAFSTVDLRQPIHGIGSLPHMETAPNTDHSENTSSQRCPS